MKIEVGTGLTNKRKIAFTKLLSEPKNLISQVFLVSNNKLLQILASVGIRSKKLPLHEDYILTISNCGDQGEPKPAVMADRLVLSRFANILWHHFY